MTPLIDSALIIVGVMVAFAGPAVRRVEIRCLSNREEDRLGRHVRQPSRR